MNVHTTKTHIPLNDLVAFIEICFLKESHNSFMRRSIRGAWVYMRVECQCFILENDFLDDDQRLGELVNLIGSLARSGRCRGGTGVWRAGKAWEKLGLNDIHGPDKRNISTYGSFQAVKQQTHRKVRV